MSHPSIILGTGQFGLDLNNTFSSPSTIQPALATLKSYSIFRIDTSRHYPSTNPGTGELVLGQSNLDGFTIDTKVWSQPGRHTPENLAKSLDESLSSLDCQGVNVLYLHYPDTKTPLTEVCHGMNELHKTGKFKHWGISNFTIEQIREMLQICDANRYIKPTVYQGAYSALARDAESQLLPLLRANDISFYAYSAAAGGAFSAYSSRLNDSTRVGEIFRAQYGAQPTQDAVGKVIAAASKHGLSGHETALRWVLYHSALKAGFGDAVVLSARNVEQLEQTLKACEGGPLPEDMVDLVEQIWEMVVESGHAPLYSMFTKKE